jgi:uncharacterized membrane protein
MNLSNSQVVVLASFAAVGCGMMGGLLFAFSNFVMQAISQQPAESGIKTMQAVNLKIQNPIFFALFFGTTAVSVLIVVNSFWNFSKAGSLPLLFAAVLYLVGTFGVTVVFNVPLNNALAGHLGETADASKLWREYVPQWTLWNHLRTVASVLASVLFTWSAVMISQSVQ